MRILGKWNDIHPEAEIGKDTTIWSWNYIGKCKIGKRCKIANWNNIGDGVVMGDDCSLQGHVMLNNNTKVGSRVFFAGGVETTDILYPIWKPIPESAKSPVTIGNDVVLGNSCMLRAGCVIGDGAVIGMGAVVTHDVPSGEVWVGNPARFHCTRGDYEVKRCACREY